MSEIILHPTSAGWVTCVSNYFIDDYMVDADGEYVKVYLYLLRCVSGNISGLSVSMMAEALDHTQKDIKKALCYWEKQGLISLGYDAENDINSISLCEVTSRQEQDYIQETPVQEVSFVSEPFVSEPEMSLEGSSLLLEDSRAKGVLYMSEKLLGHPLAPADVNSIIYWHDTLDLSWDLIEYIVEYCVDNGSTHFNYMNRVAINMSKNGVKNAEEARILSGNHSTAVFAVKRAFGISGRNLGDIEMKYINKWLTEYAFSTDIISQACGRTILKIQKPSFEYADSILTNWRDQGVQTIEDLERADRDFARETITKSVFLPAKKTTAASRKVPNFPERDTDYSLLERKLLQS